MENKVTFTKNELFVLIGGAVLAWDNKIGIGEEFDVLEKRLDKVINNNQVKETEESLEILDKNLDEAIGKNETYVDILNKLIDLYEEGVE